MDRELEELFSRLSVNLPSDLFGDEGSSSMGSKSHDEMGDLRGQIRSHLRGYSGCRYLERRLEFGVTLEEFEAMLLEILDDIEELMIDPNTSFFVQSFMKRCNPRQITSIIESLCRRRMSLISVCLNPFGTRVIQRLLEYVTSQEQARMLIEGISPNTPLLAVDPNGYHIIQHILMRFPDHDTRPIIMKIAEQCLEIATSKGGCCVLQTCVEHAGDYRAHIIAQIISIARHLAGDPFGNYVVQHLMEMRQPAVMHHLFLELRGSFSTLSCSKYASNVVERFLTQSSPELASLIIRELLLSFNVTLLLVDPYGNFVIQQALTVSQGYDRQELLSLVRENAHIIHNNHYGKKVLERVLTLR